MFNINCKKFEEALTDLINNSGLTIAEAYYIVENAALNLKILYNNLAMQESLDNTQLDSTIEVPVIDDAETQQE